MWTDMWIIGGSVILFLLDSTAKDEGRYAPYLSSKGEFEWLMASPSESCSRHDSPCSRAWADESVGNLCEVSWDPLRLLEESVYLKNLWFHLSLACTQSAGWASLRNGTHSHYFQPGPEGNGCPFKTGAPRAQEPGLTVTARFQVHL